jgi:hypothetical protein
LGAGREIAVVKDRLRQRMATNEASLSHDGCCP